jgi:hypothetical protein
MSADLLQELSHELTVLSQDVTMRGMDKTLSRVADAAQARKSGEREFARTDRVFRAAVLAAHKRGASLRAIRDASGSAVSHESIRRIVAAAAREGGA